MILQDHSVFYVYEHGQSTQFLQNKPHDIISDNQHKIPMETKKNNNANQPHNRGDSIVKK